MSRELSPSVTAALFLSRFETFAPVPFYFNTYSISSNGFQLDASGNNEFRFTSLNNTTIIAPMTLEWTHIAVRSDGQRTTLYFNGDSVASGDFVENAWNQI